MTFGNPFYSNTSHQGFIGRDGTFYLYTPQGGHEGERARDGVDSDGRIVLNAVSSFEMQPDGTQKEVWYVP